MEQVGDRLNEQLAVRADDGVLDHVDLAGEPRIFKGSAHTVCDLTAKVCNNDLLRNEYPAVRQPDGSFELVKDKHGFVLGGMEGIRYREYTLNLKPGSRLFVYTDGVPEATDGNQQMYGPDRMLEALRKAETKDPQTILESVKSSVASFVGEAEQFDDLTMLCLEYKGKQD